MRRSVLLLAALLAAGACGVDAISASPPPDRHQPVSTTLGPPTATGAPSPSPVEPKGGVADPRPVPWESATPVDGGKRVRLVWWSGVEPCTTLDRVAVRETAESVEITLYEGPAKDARDAVCIQVAVLKTTTVELDAPLGERKITDGAA